ncbi:MAG: Na(+)/H(+) antiporter subunit D [Planctomycetota bacterium]|nr:Na(+)/H(+) antiporter subunit D [Planctomycetota bacterium]
MPSFPPALVLSLGALLIPFLRGPLRKLYLLALPIVSFAALLATPQGSSFDYEAFGHTLTLMQVDKTSLLFGYVFHFAAFVGVLYALHVKDTTQQVSAVIYAGMALGAVFAGDLITFWLFWEGLAFSSVFLILARRQADSNRAAMHYLLVQIVSGLLLLVGIALYMHGHDGATAMARLTPSGSGHSIFNLDWAGPGVWLIFLGLGIKCAWPLLHSWVTVGYPAATATGAVFLSAFTTKCAVYALVRLFPGTEELIWIGVGMAGFPIFYAVIENDLRRVLCYSMINQIGFMVVGVGIGTELALNGAMAHAFCDIIFKGLLFMTMGAVLFRTGRMNGSDLGGLHRTMPWTAAFCAIGAASISAFPLFSAFISKSLIMIAAAREGYHLVWLVLLFAAAGVLEHAGIKIPFFAFFAHDSGLRPKEAPRNMLAAMAISGLACIGLGSFPDLLYRHLPYAIPDYALPYTWPHVIQQTQLLVWSALAVGTLMLLRFYPPELRSVNLDADWWYRKATRAFVAFGQGPLMRIFGWLSKAVHETIPTGLRYFARNPGGAVRLAFDRVALGWAGLFRGMPAVDAAQERLREDQARFAETTPGAAWPISTTVLYTAVVFLVFLLVVLA